jgi:3-(3-hydroxy-phenyl)propionate hydroxylase
VVNHAVVIAGGGPTGLMLAGELALAGIDVAIVERRDSQELAGSRAGGLHARTIEVLDQRGIADRFLSEGRVAQVVAFNMVPLDISDFPTRHPYALALFQNHIERILAGWTRDLGVPIYHDREVTGFAQDDSGVSIDVSDGRALRADYLVGCDGGRSLIRKAAGIDFPGWDPTTSWLIAEVEMRDEPALGMRSDVLGIHGMHRLEPGGSVRIVLTEREQAHSREPTLADLGDALNVGVQDAVNLGWKLAQVIRGSSPDTLLDSYHAERYPVAARVLRNTMAQMALRRTDERSKALGDIVAEFFSMSEPRNRMAAEMSGLGIRYDVGEGHPLLGRRMPDLDLITAGGPVRAFTLLHEARPVLLNLGEPGRLDSARWADRVRMFDASYDGAWDLPAIGSVAAPTAVLIRPDGYVAWVGESSQLGLVDALTRWFGPPGVA